MRDLDTERRLVRKRIEDFHFEPVNAENFKPSGQSAWEKIERELETSDVMVLILGSTYGWVPDRGPRSGEGRSVTHLEYEMAKEKGLPILAFAKRLDYEHDGKTPDAQARDEFRTELGDWADGRFYVQFEHGDELPDLVGSALTTMLADDYQHRQIRTRAESPDRREEARPAALSLSDQLVDVVTEGRALLLAGAGFSVDAGLPTTPMFAAIMGKFAGRESSPVVRSQFSYFQSIEASDGRPALIAAAERFQALHRDAEPTTAHQVAVRRFPWVVTTNYDDLFERAAVNQDIRIPTISDDLEPGPVPERVIVKLHGSMHEPESMILTDGDVSVLDRRRPIVWNAIRSRLLQAPVVVAGTSLQDPSTVRLLTEASELSISGKLRGFVVGSRIDADDRNAFRRWGLEAIKEDLQRVFRALDDAIAHRTAC